MAITPTSGSSQAAMMRGAGITLVGRSGALIDLLSLFLFAQMYGSETYGLFLVMWFIVQALAIISDFGMTMALQRFVPEGEKDEIHAGRVLKYAISASVGISCVVALIMVLLAPQLASLINANERDSQYLVLIIQIYAWAIPLWCLIDVATAAIRARKVFGPEVKVRVFYEQGFRLIFGTLFYFLGILSLGLFISHLIGLLATAIFAFRLLDKYYGLAHIFAKTGRDKELVRQMFSFATSMVLPNLAKKWHSGLPVLLLNVMLPGAQGAQAAGIYGAARKIVSFLNVFRESFEYVLAPLASESRVLEKTDDLMEMFRLATRLSIAFLIPAATMLICFREEVLRQNGSEFVAGASAALVLAIGRTLEAASGPSTSILAMIGRYRLPLVNAIVGVSLTAFLGIWLIPNAHWFGGGLSGNMIGAAIAAAVGINATSLAAHLEVRFLYRLNPYDIRILRPIVAALIISAPLALLITETSDVWRTAHFIIGLSGFIGAVLLLVRYGFHPLDANLVLPKAIKKTFPLLVRRKAPAE